MKHTTPLDFTALHPSYLTCGGNHSLVEKEPTNPRHSMFTNHVCSLNILRTQSPNSCPDSLPDPPGIVIFSFEVLLLCMESCFLFTFRVTLGSFCGCVEPQIKES
jgi:hypothetical protein